MLPRDETTQSTNRIEGERRWFALGAVLVTMFFSSLDQTIVSTAMPVIIGDLQGFAIYAWVFTAYMMASTIMVPIYGKLSDVYGRKPFYVAGLALFMLGSALSGQAHSMMELIIFRAFQGIGGGAMISMPRATIGDIFNPRERGRWMGVIAMTFGLASIIGPFFGGWITDHWGWRWIFYINLPVAAIALGALLYALPRVRIKKKVHIDWTGSGVLIAGLLPLLLAFTWAGSQYAWGSPQIIGLFAFSAVMLAAFAWVERRATEPIIPIEFFKVRLFATANLVGFLLTIGMFGTLMFLPIYVQGVLGLSAQNSGAVLTPMMLSVIFGSLVAGQIMTRTGRYKVLTMIGAAVMAIGMFLMTRLGADSTWGTVIRDMVVTGVGIGALMPTLNVAVQNAFPYEVMGVVNASQQFVRSLGGAIAAPILGTVLAKTFSSQLQSNLPSTLTQAVSGLSAAQQKQFLDPQTLINSQTQAAIRSQFSAFGAQADQLYQAFIHAVHQALASGIGELFLIALGVSLAAFAVTFFLPEISLKHDEFYEKEAAGGGGGAARVGEGAAVAGAGIMVAAGGAAGGATGGTPGEPPDVKSDERPRRRRRIIAIAALLLAAALLALAIQGLLSRNHLTREIAALRDQTQALSASQQTSSTSESTVSVASSLSSEQASAVQSPPSTVAASELPSAVQSSSSVTATEATRVALETTVSGNGAIRSTDVAYAAGAVATLVAVPDTGWRFAGWSGDASGTDNPLQLVMDDTKNVTATFAVAIYTIAATSGPDGTIRPSGNADVAYGGSLTFVMNPAAHYHVEDVIADGTSVGAVTSYTFTHTTSDHTIEATFALDRATLTTSVVGDGAMDPSQGTYDYGDEVTVTATPSNGARFVGWGGDASGAANPLAVIMDGNRWITAVFAPDVYAITSTVDGRGAIVPGGGLSIEFGGSQTYAITPAEHYHVSDVVVDGMSVGAVEAYTFTEVGADHTIAATFAPDQERLTTQTVGQGTVSAVEGMVAYGDAVTLEAHPAPGWRFAEWSGDAQGSENPLTVTMDGDRNIMATFVEETHRIAAIAGEHGTIEPSGDIDVSYGASQTFTIAPAEGYRIAGVSVDGVAIGARTGYTFDDVVGEHVVRATFEKDMHVVTANASANGTIVPAGGVTVDSGTDQSFTIMPAEHYHVRSVTVDGASVGTVTRYTFLDVTADHTITASFAMDMYTVSSSAGTGGSIDPDGAWLVAYGHDLSFKITPAPGQHIADIVVDGVSVGAVATYSFRAIDRDHTITATFAKDASR